MFYTETFQCWKGYLTHSSLNLPSIVIFIHYKPRIAISILDL